jgi:hypothetical protein
MYLSHNVPSSKSTIIATAFGVGHSSVLSMSYRHIFQQFEVLYVICSAFILPSVFTLVISEGNIRDRVGWCSGELRNYICEALVSNFEQDTGYPNQSCRMVPDIGHDRFLQNPFQFIVPESSYHSTLYRHCERLYLLLISQTFEFIINLPWNALWICNHFVNNSLVNFYRYEQPDFQ